MTLTIWLDGQAAKTSPFHGEISGSIPDRATNRLCTIPWYEAFLCLKGGVSRFSAIIGIVKSIKKRERIVQTVEN